MWPESVNGKSVNETYAQPSEIYVQNALFVGRPFAYPALTPQYRSLRFLSKHDTASNCYFVCYMNEELVVACNNRILLYGENDLGKSTCSLKVKHPAIAIQDDEIYYIEHRKSCVSRWIHRLIELMWFLSKLKDMSLLAWQLVKKT